MAKLNARLVEINVFPEPAFAEVNMKILDCPSLPDINSRLVRTTRNASLMALPLFSFTTISRTSFRRLNNASKPRRFLYERGISPTNGTVTPSRSRRDLTDVSRLLKSSNSANGSMRPNNKAIIITLNLMGLVGWGLLEGGYKTFVLYAVNTLES